MMRVAVVVLVVAAAVLVLVGSARETVGWS